MSTRKIYSSGMDDGEVRSDMSSANEMTGAGTYMINGRVMYKPKSYLAGSIRPFFVAVDGRQICLYTKDGSQFAGHLLNGAPTDDDIGRYLSVFTDSSFIAGSDISKPDPVAPEPEQRPAISPVIRKHW